MKLLDRLLRKNSPPRPRAAPAVSEEAVRAMIRAAGDQFRAGQLDDAKAALEEVLRCDPRQAKAMYLLAGIAINRGDTDTGVGLVREALALEPDNAEYHFSLGSVLFTTARVDDAISHYQEAVRLRPDMAAWREQLDRALEEREWQRIHAQQAIDAEAHFDRGNMLQKAGRLREAEQAFEMAAELSPDNPAPHVNVALTRRDQWRPAAAEAPARRAVELDPERADAWFVLGTVLAGQARHREAIECLKRAISLKPDHDGAWSFLMFSLNYADDVTPEQVFEEHLRCARVFEAATPVVRPAARRRESGRLRIGYVSADFVRHPVAQFIEAPLRHHDKARFETFCYFVGAQEDSVTQTLKSLAHNWRMVPELDAEALAQLIRDDRIDILVELSGHSKGHRLATLASRPAPVQVTYLGYPNTTGMRAVDYRLTDAFADPPGASDHLNVERLLRLPGSFLCYTPAETDLAVQDGPPQRSRPLTFGSFNNFQKISPSCVALWSRVLHAVPGSHLFIKTHGLDDPGLVAAFKSRFERQGIAAHRLSIAPRTTSHRAHLTMYREIDVALDTFPYHGTTTTFDALWMGVPVLTLAGDRHASRVGVSILANLDLAPALVAHNADEFVAKAAALAARPATLAELRSTLRMRLASSPLLDGADFARKLEAAYLRMWEEADGQARVARA